MCNEVAATNLFAGSPLAFYCRQQKYFVMRFPVQKLWMKPATQFPWEAAAAAVGTPHHLSTTTTGSSSNVTSPYTTPTQTTAPTGYNVKNVLHSVQSPKELVLAQWLHIVVGESPIYNAPSTLLADVAAATVTPSLTQQGYTSGQLTNTHTYIHKQINNAAKLNTVDAFVLILI